jgi:hypothetical protein
VARVWSVFNFAARAATGRTTLTSRRIGLSMLVAWSLASALVLTPGPGVGVAQARDLQPALLQAAIARLAPQRKGTTDIYAIAVAGWAQQDVFVKEVDGALAAMEQILPIRGRTLRLVNNAKTTQTTPLANQKNIAAAVRAIAKTMDKDEDVLLLFLTSHGGQNGIALQLPGGSSTVLGPQELKAMLDGAGIKNRVVIVSACFSGVFVEPLANDDTIVLTAADAQHPSFGCAAGRDWTYFGDAMFKQGVRPGADLKQAFDHARILIRGWEMMDRLPPSNPQGHFGSALAAKLDPVLRSTAGQ